MLKKKWGQVPPTACPQDPRASAGAPACCHRILGCHMAPSGPGGLDWIHQFMLDSRVSRKSVF